MKAIFIGGLLDKHRKIVSEDDKCFVFTINKCDTFPSRGYKEKWEYILRCVVNIGEPIAYYQYVKPVVKAISESYERGANLAQVAQQAGLQQQAGLNIFRGLW